MAETYRSDQSVPKDGFQQAAAAAEAEAGRHHWHEMLPWERTREIYAQLRRLDEVRGAAISFVPGRAARPRSVGGSTQ